MTSSSSRSASPTASPIRRPRELVDAGLARAADLPVLERVTEELSLAITPEMVEGMEHASPADPLYRQFVPSAEELTATPEELADPIGDDRHSPVKGITHRYPDRLLLKPVHVCPVYCRFCFRREKVGRGAEALSAEELAAALDYVRSRPEVWEVILTGGDPLMLSPRRLAALMAELDAIPHVEVIRFHSRVPVVDPGRVSDDLVRALRVGTATWVCVHTNHARELTEGALAALARLADAGIPLLSQTVLLRGVNDDPAALEALFRALVRNRVKPYYLHHPDLVRGTSHLRVTLATGQRLMRDLRGRVSGLCQPIYVLDVPGGYGKVPVAPGYVERAGAGGAQGGSRQGTPPFETAAAPPPQDSSEDGGEDRYRVRDVHGRWHQYPPGPLGDDDR